jgi:hypothetical protein
MDLRMTFHSQEEEEREEGERKEQEDKYLQCNWDTHIKSVLLRRFQPSLEIKARFTSLILLRPKPPISLGLQREPQALRERTLLLINESSIIDWGGTEKDEMEKTERRKSLI